MNFPSIPAKTDDKGKSVDPTPPCTGNWRRNADGSLTPMDEATAITAGLVQPPAEAPSPQE